MAGKGEDVTSNHMRTAQLATLAVPCLVVAQLFQSCLTDLSSGCRQDQRTMHSLDNLTFDLAVPIELQSLLGMFLEAILLTSP